MEMIQKNESPHKKPRIQREEYIMDIPFINQVNNHFLKTKTQSYFISLSPGLEFLAEEEIKEKLNPTAIKRINKSGKVFFATDKNLLEILKLRCADNIYAFLTEVGGVPSDHSGLNFLQKVPLNIKEVDWEAAIALWRVSLSIYSNKFNQNSLTNISNLQTSIFPENKEKSKFFNNLENNILESIQNIEPIFRVTGKRTGDQTYKSPEVAGCIGAGIIDK
jgi:hypothetical protein